MEEIKVGDFIRTTQGTIAQIEEDEFEIKNNVRGQILYEKWVEGNRYYEVIVKHSPNLIDLIQCGDYVNGYKVTNVINKEPCPSGKCVDIDADRPSEYCTLWEDDIETIVTKEQFENIEYKVEER